MQGFRLVGRFRRCITPSSCGGPALALRQRQYHTNSSSPSANRPGGFGAGSGTTPAGGGQSESSELFHSGPYPAAPPSYTPGTSSPSGPAPLATSGGKVPMYEFNGKRYNSYHGMLDAYEDHLEGYMRRSSEAVQTIRHKAHMLRRFEQDGSKYISREYARTFIPLVIVLWFYLYDQSNRTCAEMAQEKIKTEAQQKLKTKWIEV